MLLDEPTRGMDRVHKDALAERCGVLAEAGAAVVVATHDTEFAATFADRVVLLGQGVTIADATPLEVLAGGWHFSTEWPGSPTARRSPRATARRSCASGFPERPHELERSPPSCCSPWLVGAGLAWYERARPSSRVLALVAALAALAVVGRLAFAAIPNVKPTTDIVLFGGYALGRRARFRGGAVTALVSNVFLSQGPWTVWQMAAWGGVGVLGARDGPRACAAASRAGSCSRGVRVRRARLRRLDGPLPVDARRRQDLDSYLAVSATSLPYNLAHAIGNVGFCLLIGPAFVRALRRYRRRFEVRWPARAGRRPPGCWPGGRARPLLARRGGVPRRAGRTSYLRRPRTATAASAAAPGYDSNPLFRAGRRSAWPPPGATLATSSPSGEIPGRLRSPVPAHRAGTSARWSAP